MHRIKKRQHHARGRVIIENIWPRVDEGYFAIKRVVGEEVRVEADIFSDGHETLSCRLRYKKDAPGSRWRTVPMQELVNDRWRAVFHVTECGGYLFTIEGWLDPFKTWRRDLTKKLEANLDVTTDLEIGGRLIQAAALRASRTAAGRLRTFQKLVGKSEHDLQQRIEVALSEPLNLLINRCPDRSAAATLPKPLQVWVDRERAGFSSWYEMFPRSCGPGTRHGTFQDCILRLPYVAEMGFDVLYLPPIHPVGKTHRKGANNSLKALPQDCGSPWAIGSDKGGHKAVHPQLGTLEDFRRLVKKARKQGLEIALDIAFQCSPDHPYTRQHPEWFRHRPDGSIQYAENPPKKYEDIYPFDFETENWKELWKELKSIFDFWIEQGVLIFRVDNPHTKPFAFWEWALEKIRRRNPEVLFLSEAFTRPRLMQRLAKLGFSQSYTYFAWRNNKWELTEYFQQLSRNETIEYFRPSLWPNTPDILTEFLQTGGRPAFVIRLFLAATLAPNYGIYGPAFELCIDQPREAGSEEYLNSEKYEIKDWDLESPLSLCRLIGSINQIRRQNRALQNLRSLHFHRVDNDQLICYSKRAGANVILIVVNLDPQRRQSGWVELDLEELWLTDGKPFELHDLLGNITYQWTGRRNYVELDPTIMPAHLFRVTGPLQSE